MKRITIYILAMFLWQCSDLADEVQNPENPLLRSASGSGKQHDDLQMQLDEANKELEDTKKKVADLEERLKGNPKEEIARLKAEIEELKAFIAELEKEIDELKLQLAQAEALANNGTPLSAISLMAETVSLPVGVSLQVYASGVYGDNSRRDLTSYVNWSSLTPTILEASEDGRRGLFTAVAVGSVQIAAQLGEVSAQIQIDVSTAELTAIEIPMPEDMPAGGQGHTFTAQGLYTDGQQLDISADVSWFSDDTDVVIISNESGEMGFAKGLRLGTARIVAVHNKISSAVEFMILEPTLVSLHLDDHFDGESFPGCGLAWGSEQEPDDHPFGGERPNIVGENEQMRVFAYYSDCHYDEVTDEAEWFVADPLVAAFIVDNNGLLEFLSAGITTVWASYSDLIIPEEAREEVEVIENSLEGIRFFGWYEGVVSNPEIPNLDYCWPEDNPGHGGHDSTANTYQFGLQAVYTDCTQVDISENTEVTWVSSDSAVADFADIAFPSYLTIYQTGTITIDVSFQGASATIPAFDVYFYEGGGDPGDGGGDSGDGGFDPIDGFDPCDPDGCVIAKI